MRAEYRYDHTIGPGYFYRRGAITDASPALAHDQHTVFLVLIGYFEHAFSFARGSGS